jgi:hypothetical protein
MEYNSRLPPGGSGRRWEIDTGKGQRERQENFKALIYPK